MSSFHEALCNLSGENLFIACPDVLDFTNTKKQAKIIVYSQKTTIEIPFPEDKTKLFQLLGFLEFGLNQANCVLVSWNLKNFLSYVQGRTGNKFQLDSKIFDLSFLESYVGNKGPCPTSFKDAYQRLQILTKKTNWTAINKAYQSVYLPLLHTIPSIETAGVVHRSKHAKVYPHYQVDFQVFGRLKTNLAFSSSFNPHSMSDEEKEQIRACGFGYNFMYFDYSHMEVSVLQWLSQDDYLGELLNSGKDIYAAIWEGLTHQPCSDAHRQKCKELFLPVVFGFGAENLAKQFNWPLDVTRNVMDRLVKTMPIAFNWIKNQQKAAEDGGEVSDCFGRVRTFDAPYKARNFSIQSPSSFICLDKLNLLHKALEGVAQVVMHIHDGYVVATHNLNMPKTYQITKNILESESELYSGLKLKTKCLFGQKLNDLKQYNP